MRPVLLALLLSMSLQTVGWAGASRDFDGNGDYLSCGTNISAHMPTTAVSVCAWVNIEGDNASGQDQSVIDNRLSAPATNSNGFVLQVQKASASHAIRFFIYDTGFRGGGATGLTAGVWTHICGTWSKASGDVKTYKNGVVTNTSASNTSDITYGVTHVLSVGRTDGNLLISNEYVNGNIAYAHLWNREITLAEVVENGFHPGFPAESLVGYWPVWNPADPEGDLSGQGNNCTITAAVESTNGPPVFLTTPSAWRRMLQRWMTYWWKFDELVADV